MAQNTQNTNKVVSDSVLGVKRFYTKAGTTAQDMFSWKKSDARIDNPVSQEVVFEQKGVEFPDSWSTNAINIVAQKYFSGTPGTDSRESSLKQLVDRVADTITEYGFKEGYFANEEERDTFEQELKYILFSQKASFNSPVWFNIGAADRTQQASACFILAVEDTMPAILEWYREEGMIFKGGSGSGINVSSIRSSHETLGNSAGKASGPLSFMRGADSSAGAIKSGGKTRRAAKMVMLDVSHPDVEEFIWCKALEERKARVLTEAGFEMDLNGRDSHSIQYQNANNSVRVTDEFMKAVEQDDEWNLTGVKDGEVIKKIKARNIMRQVAEAAWECADPGMQYSTTINDWHTVPNKGPITGSNPCSEYMSIDNSACNLASINLIKYLSDDGRFNVDAFKHTVEVMFLAQEILCGYSVYPTEKIAKNTYDYRQIGLGFANLGALLMAQGLAYDSEEGRAQAGVITSLMTGAAYATSAKIAKRVGAFAGFERDREGMIRVLKKHRDKMSTIDTTLVQDNLFSAASSSWDEAVEQSQLHGVRNSQATVLAPTGTISFMMDCDTTGIEPDFALVKMKNLVGGGTMKIVNNSVTRALRSLGYDQAQTDEIVEYLNKEMNILGAPHLKHEHVKVFAVAVGDNAIHYNGHIKMMAACQPFISGAISKTVNMPEEATVEDVEKLYIDSWKMGLKAVAIYRDNCKVAQPLGSAKKSGDSDKSDDQAETKVEQNAAPVASEQTAQTLAPNVVEAQSNASDFSVKQPIVRELPQVRNSKTYKFKVADFGGYFTASEYEDGTLGEIFINVAKQGSTMSGIMDAFARSVSYGLQHGVPLKSYVKGMTSMVFAPSGATNDKQITSATSIIDYIFKRIANDYLSFEDKLDLGLVDINDIDLEQASLDEVQTTDANSQNSTVGETKIESSQGPAADSSTILNASSAEIKTATQAEKHETSAPLCSACGNQTQRSGSCYACSACGATTGCG